MRLFLLLSPSSFCGTGDPFLVVELGGSRGRVWGACEHFAVSVSSRWSGGDELGASRCV